MHNLLNLSKLLCPADRGLKHFGKVFFGKHFWCLYHYFLPCPGFCNKHGVRAKTHLVRWPSVYHVLSGATGSIEPVSTQLSFLHPVERGGKFDFRAFPLQSWAPADNSIIFSSAREWPITKHRIKALAEMYIQKNCRCKCENLKVSGTLWVPTSIFTLAPNWCCSRS